MRSGKSASWIRAAGASLLVLGLTACTAPAPRVGNYDLCRANQRGCDESGLDASQRAALVQEREDRHYRDCLARLRCNESALTDAQRDRVRASVDRLNFAACLRGESSCDSGRLDTTQQLAVRSADQRRNLDACLAGLVVCNDTGLSPEERVAVRNAYLQRNFTGCMNAIGTLVGCRVQDLSPVQREAVRQRQLAVNYFFCANGVVTCDPALLTDEQRARMAREPALLRL